MRAWFWAHRRAFAASFRGLLTHPFATLLTLLVIGVALALPGLLWALLANGDRVVARLPIEPQLTLFLAPGTSRQAADKLAKQAADTWQAKARFVPRDEAYRDLVQRANLGEMGDALPENPLPDALVLSFPASDGPAQAATVVKGWEGVSDVIQDATWAARLAALTHLGRSVVLWLAGLLALGLVVITGNTVRLQILLRRDEIEVSQLIGATAAFIRRPFLYFAALQGLLGGVAAWALVGLATAQLDAPVGALAKLYGTDLALTGLPVWQGLILLAVAALLSWLGAWIAVTRHLSAMRAR